MKNYLIAILMTAVSALSMGFFIPTSYQLAKFSAWENSARISSDEPVIATDRVARQLVHTTVQELEANRASGVALPPHRQLRAMVRTLAAPDVNDTLEYRFDVMDSAAQEAQESVAQFHCLAAAVYFEARGEPLTGQMAVARVVLNRVQVRRFPEDICSVVTQRKQFSFVRSGQIPQPNEDSRAWRRARAVAYLAQHETWQKAMGHDTDKALFFHADYVAPSWGQVRPRIGQVGAHIFYR